MLMFYLIHADDLFILYTRKKKYVLFSENTLAHQITNSHTNITGRTMAQCRLTDTFRKAITSLRKLFGDAYITRRDREIQGDSVARGPKLLSIKNCVIEIMT
jgi:hypothetical protein